MKVGVCRVKDPFLGDCAKVKWFAGDGAPYLQRDIYEQLRFEPRFEDLPEEDPVEKAEVVAMRPRRSEAKTLQQPEIARIAVSL